MVVTGEAFKKKKRKSFIIHIDSLSVLDELTDEQAGRLLRAMRSHHDGADYEMDSITKIVFSSFKAQFERDHVNYVNTCKQRALAGSAGGRQKVANASKCKQALANLADSDSGSGSGSGSEDIDTNVSSSTDVDRCPQSEIISIWGEVLPELRQPRVWDGQRAKDLAARWKSKDVKANSVDYWRGLFEYIRRSDFLMGRVTNFSASLDWVVKASNYNKIIEGKYHE